MVRINMAMNVKKKIERKWKKVVYGRIRGHLPTMFLSNF